MKARGRVVRLSTLDGILGVARLYLLVREQHLLRGTYWVLIASFLCLTKIRIVFLPTIHVASARKAASILIRTYLKIEHVT